MGAVALSFTLVTLLAMAVYMYYNVANLNAKYAQLKAPLQSGGVEMEQRV